MHVQLHPVVDVTEQILHAELIQQQAEQGQQQHAANAEPGVDQREERQQAHPQHHRVERDGLAEVGGDHQPFHIEHQNDAGEQHQLAAQLRSEAGLIAATEIVKPASAR